MNAIRIADIIFGIIRDYSPSIYSLTRACDELIRILKQNGHEDAYLEPGNGRNSRSVRVDGHRFRIVRNAGWTHYDVRIIA